MEAVCGGFQKEIFSERQSCRWAAPFIKKVFMCFKSGNSLAESANASVLAFLMGEQNHAELVAFLLQYINEKNAEQRARFHGFHSCFAWNWNLSKIRR